MNKFLAGYLAAVFVIVALDMLWLGLRNWPVGPTGVDMALGRPAECRSGGGRQGRFELDGKGLICLAGLRQAPAVSLSRIGPSGA